MKSNNYIECAECGNAFRYKPSDLRRTKSGKLFCSRKCWGRHQTKLHEENNGMPKWATTILKSAKKRASKKGIEFLISLTEMKELILISNGKCMLSGIPFDISPSNERHKKRPHFPSLDRIDSSLGYINGNVRIVCVAVNIAMNSWGDDVLFGIAVGVLHDALPLPKNRGKFIPTFRGKRIGTFDNMPDAIRAYLSAKKLHKSCTS